MGDSPKENEARFRMVLNAWKTIAPESRFAGMTVHEFEDFIKPSFDKRQALEVHDDQRAQLINEREDADKASNAKINAVISSVGGDPAFGDDSSLWEAMGRTRKSERATGLTRKGNKTDGSPPPAP